MSPTNLTPYDELAQDLSDLFFSGSPSKRELQVLRERAKELSSRGWRKANDGKSIGKIVRWASCCSGPITDDGIILHFEACPRLGEQPAPVRQPSDDAPAAVARMGIRAMEKQIEQLEAALAAQREEHGE